MVIVTGAGGFDAQFGRQPALTTALADGPGFRHDGDVETPVRRALVDTTG